MDSIQLTPNGALALQFLQGQDGPVTGSDIAAATGLNPQGIHGVLNGLVKKGLVAKADSVTRPFTNKAGLTEEKSYVTYIVTDLGSEFVAA
jgi:DNA-binding MarR family transcriptional regulator